MKCNWCENEVKELEGGLCNVCLEKGVTTKTDEVESEVSVEAKVGVTERRYTEDEVINLVREEFTEAFQEDKNPEDFKDELYTIFGIIRSALKRK